MVSANWVGPNSCRWYASAVISELSALSGQPPAQNRSLTVAARKGANPTVGERLPKTARPHFCNALLSYTMLRKEDPGDCVTEA
jgi:hypothetical protein